jgi:hypothetical protein
LSTVLNQLTMLLIKEKALWLMELLLKRLYNEDRN